MLFNTKDFSGREEILASDSLINQATTIINAVVKKEDGPTSSPGHGRLWLS